MKHIEKDLGCWKGLETWIYIINNLIYSWDKSWRCMCLWMSDVRLCHARYVQYTIVYKVSVLFTWSCEIEVADVRYSTLQETSPPHSTFYFIYFSFYFILFYVFFIFVFLFSCCYTWKWMYFSSKLKHTYDKQIQTEQDIYKCVRTLGTLLSFLYLLLTIYNENDDDDKWMTVNCMKNKNLYCWNFVYSNTKGWC